MGVPRPPTTLRNQKARGIWVRGGVRRWKSGVQDEVEYRLIGGPAPAQHPPAFRGSGDYVETPYQLVSDKENVGDDVVMVWKRPANLPF